MELLNEIIEKAREAIDLIEAECHHQASFELGLIEQLMMQLPAGVEDWAQALRDEFRLFTEAREWMDRDHLLAIEKIEQAVASFEAIKREARDRHIAPELPEDISADTAA